MKNFIVIENVNKYYESEGKLPDYYAVDVTNFSISRGEFFCILGPSGCGKSTLLSMMAGFEDPTNGKVFINGREVTAPNPKNVSVFQQYGLFPWRTVENNVKFGLEFKEGYSDNKKTELVNKYLQLVGLEGYKYAKPHELSGGMKQRVAIARSLVVQPDVLFMDEPFGALDEMTRLKLGKELLRIWKEEKVTIVYVTHNIDESIYLGDRIAVMSPSPGKIKEIIEIKKARPRDLASKECDAVKKKILGHFGI